MFVRLVPFAKTSNQPAIKFISLSLDVYLNIGPSSLLELGFAHKKILLKL